jgi:hypothetical protein
MKTIVGVLVCALLVSSCGSLCSKDKDDLVVEIPLSTLTDANVEFDSSKFENIYIKLVNDLDSNIFVKNNVFTELSEYEINEVITYSTPSETYLNPTNLIYALDQTNRPISSVPFDIAVTGHPIIDQFMFVGSGSDSRSYIFSSELIKPVNYFSITFYSCNEREFYTKTLRITSCHQGVPVDSD